jgi:hypothetical protein
MAKKVYVAQGSIVMSWYRYISSHQERGDMEHLSGGRSVIRHVRQRRVLLDGQVILGGLDGLGQHLHISPTDS